MEIHDDFDALAPEWNELADRVGAPPFLRPEWIRAWWRAFGHDAPTILAARDTALRAVLPLYRRGGVVRTIGDDHAVECGLLAEDASAAGAVAEGFLEAVRSRGSLLFVDPTRPGLAELRAQAAGAGWAVLVRPMARAPYLSVREDWASYYGKRDARLRSDLRRRRRRLDEEGRVTIELMTPDRAAIDRLLTEGFSVEASGWKAKGGTAITSQPATERFYREVAAWASERGQLHLAFLRLDGRPLAFELALRDQGVHYRLKVGFDASAGRFAPGKLLLARLLEDAFDTALDRFDFLGDQDPYKLEWATGLRDLLLVQVFAPRLRGRSAYATLAFGLPAARRAASIVRRR